MLDVSFMVCDPMLADKFTVSRRLEAVDTNGRSQLTTSTFAAVGVVTQQSPGMLMRMPEGQVVPRRITVITRADVRSAVQGQQPDLITWDGTDYLVTEVLPYTKFGRGFKEVIAESQTQPDVAQ